MDLEKSMTLILVRYLAGHALALDLILVTNNLKEFERVLNLKLDNWV